MKGDVTSTIVPTIDWYEVFYNSSSIECWEKFKEIINNLISTFVTLQMQTPKKGKSRLMNEQTLSKIKMKNRAYHRYLKTKDQHDYQMYAKYENQSKNACRNAVADCEESLLREVKSNPKALFRHAKKKVEFQKCNPRFSR